MVRLRPWPGRGVRAEPRSSQLWRLRLRRETQGAQRQPQRGSSPGGDLAPASARPTPTPGDLAGRACSRQACGSPPLRERLPCALCGPCGRAKRVVSVMSPVPLRGVSTVLVPFLQWGK